MGRYVPIQSNQWIGIDFGSAEYQHIESYATKLYRFFRIAILSVETILATTS